MIFINKNHMNKRILVTESEKRNILKMHNKAKSYYMLKEDEEMSSIGGELCTDTLINLVKKANKKDPYYGMPKVNSFVVGETKGTAIIEKMGKKLKLTPGMVVKLSDKISLTNGSKLIFEHIEGWGGGEVVCENNTLEYLLHWN